MRNFLKNIFITGVIAGAVFFIFAGAPAGAVDNINQASGNLGTLGSYSGLEENITVSTANVINTLLAVVGTVFFILTIYAGIRWMTAQGAEEKVTKAKDTLQAALIGLAIIMLAYAITAFVTTRLGGGAIPEGEAPRQRGRSTLCSDYIEPETTYRGICVPAADCQVDLSGELTIKIVDGYLCGNEGEVCCVSSPN